MLSLRSLPSRGVRSSLCSRSLHLSRTSTRPLSISLHARSAHKSATRRQPNLLINTSPSSSTRLGSTVGTASFRSYTSGTSPSTADELIEQIQDQYATARDEFEIATEETEKKSVYAEGDRAAAREELDKLKEMFNKAVEGENGEEVRSRIGQRIRELDNAVINLEKSALEE